MDAAPYEKMYMIDEAEWMKLKNVQYPTAAENQPPNDPPPPTPPDESEYETDDDEGGDGDEGGDEGGDDPPPRFQVPAQVPKVNPTTMQGLQLPTVEELRVNQLNQEVAIEDAQFVIADVAQQMADLDGVQGDMQALHESIQAMHADVDLDAPGKEQFKNLDEWIKEWNHINHAIDYVMENQMEFPMSYEEGLHKTKNTIMKSKYYTQWLDMQDAIRGWQGLDDWERSWEQLMRELQEYDGTDPAYLQRLRGY